MNMPSISKIRPGIWGTLIGFIGVIASIFNHQLFLWSLSLFVLGIIYLLGTVMFMMNGNPDYNSSDTNKNEIDLNTNEESETQLKEKNENSIPSNSEKLPLSGPCGKQYTKSFNGHDFTMIIARLPDNSYAAATQGLTVEQIKESEADICEWILDNRNDFSALLGKKLKMKSWMIQDGLAHTAEIDTEVAPGIFKTDFQSLPANKEPESV